MCLNQAAESLLMLHVQTGFGYFAIVVAVVARQDWLGNDQTISLHVWTGSDCLPIVVSMKDFLDVEHYNHSKND